jgi:hypothetical protein
VNASTAPPAITVSKRLERDVSRSCFLYEAERDPAAVQKSPPIRLTPPKGPCQVADLYKLRRELRRLVRKAGEAYTDAELETRLMKRVRRLSRQLKVAEQAEQQVARRRTRQGEIDGS